MTDAAHSFPGSGTAPQEPTAALPLGGRRGVTLPDPILHNLQPRLTSFVNQIYVQPNSQQ